MKKYTKFDFGRGCAPDPAGGAYSAPPDSLAGLKGSLLIRDGKEGEQRRGGEAQKELQHQAQLCLNPSLHADADRSGHRIILVVSNWPTVWPIPITVATLSGS